ncbi:ribonuclease H-like protein [Poronia punctata]|nr:ribonuclease H-like protein [Poronia punctata]
MPTPSSKRRPFSPSQSAQGAKATNAGELQHSHHPGGSTGSTCGRFPDELYLLDQGGFCGLDYRYLEIEGNEGFRHIRCPRASPKPCPCGRHSLHTDSLVVAVDGACPGNGSCLAVKSAYGVFFGYGKDNLAIRIPDGHYPHTSQRAELEAAIAGIDASIPFIYEGGQWFCENCDTPCPVEHLVIKSDSAYVVSGMVTHSKKWKKNGWRTVQNTEVKNLDLWKQLVGLVDGLYDGCGVSVDFWLVPRNQNQEADKLANIGLQMY